ncbi:MAG: hypothetical protein JWP27_2321 [Flaviaesturariibacter sp.]|nr:hypothetical protein [Flaviaesturariibacter sp.]
MNQIICLKPVRRLLLVFIACLFLSGVTVFPAAAELRFALSIVPSNSPVANWLRTVLAAYVDTDKTAGFLFYGYDWLAFAHIVLAILFVGPYRDPIRNKWVIEFGLIACVLIIPLAFFCGPLRGIPFWWQLVDCSFGVFGFALLWFCYRRIRTAERIGTIQATNLSIHQTESYELLSR